jgi:hypothetical protein
MCHKKRVVSRVASPGCPTKGKVPKTMFTFEPSSSNATEISSFPKDFVTLEGDGDMLKLRWNEDVAYDSTEGGWVRLAFPPDQLKELSVSASSKAQILDGFTGMENILVSSSADLYATCSTLSTILRILVTSPAYASRSNPMHWYKPSTFRVRAPWIWKPTS